MGDDYDYADVKRAVDELGVKYGRTVYAETGKCWTYASVKSARQIARENGAKQDPAEVRRNQKMWHAVVAVLSRGDDVDALGQAMSENDDSDVNYSGDKQKGKTALMVAAERGRTNCVAALLDEYQADTNTQSPDQQYSALILAAYKGHKAICFSLLEHGADKSLQNQYGETAEASARAAFKADVADAIAGYSSPEKLESAEKSGPSKDEKDEAGEQDEKESKKEGE